MYCLWECKMAHSVWKTVRQFFKKLNIALLYDPVILLIGLPKRIGSRDSNMCTPMFIEALFRIAKCGNN